MTDIPPEFISIFIQFPITAMVLAVVWVMEKRQDKQASESQRILRALANRIERLTVVFIAHHMGNSEAEKVTKILRELDQSGDKNHDNE